jgi:hypothetical protein
MGCDGLISPPPSRGWKAVRNVESYDQQHDFTEKERVQVEKSGMRARVAEARGQRSGKRQELRRVALSSILTSKGSVRRNF